MSRRHTWEGRLPRPAHIQHLAGAVAIALLCACDGDKSRVVDTDVAPWIPDDTEDECADSGCDPSPYFEVMYLTWSAYFGYDAQSGEVIPVWTPYGRIDPGIEVLLGSPRWERSGFDVGQTDAYCIVQLPIATSAPPSRPPYGMWHSVRYDHLAGPPLGTCGMPGYELDPTMWGSDPAMSIATAGLDPQDGSPPREWGIAIGELSPDAEGIVNSAVQPDDLPYIFGGAIGVPLLTTGWDYDVYALGFVLDEDHAVHLGLDGTLDAWLADDVRQGTSVVSAWYSVSALYIYIIGP